MSIATLDASVATVIHFLFQEWNCEVHCQKRYADAYRKMMDSATKQSWGNLNEFLKHWSCKEVTVREDRLGSEEQREALMGMRGSASNVWTLRSVRNTYISADEKRFPVYVRDTLKSLNDCYVG